MSPREAVNAVRTRAGVGILKDGKDFRKRLHNEHRVEFAFENHRFWDIRRWKEGELTEEILGLSLVLDQESGEISYTREVVQERPWNDKYYWYPYSESERYKNHNLIQNSGW